jgi:GNAT superfamily N-acetyltransferase
MNEVPLSGLVARRAGAAELPPLLELPAADDIGRSREGAGRGDRACATAFDAIDDDPNPLLLAAEPDGRLVGMLQLTFTPGLSRRGAWRANIGSVRVERKLRGCGIGRWLIARALDAARSRGCRPVQLTSDKRRTAAHRLYGSLGVVASHEGFRLELEVA